KRSDKVLDVRGRSTADGADIIQYTNANSDNQLWLLEPQADGYYVIVSKNSGKAFAVSGGSQVNGTQVIQWPKSTQDHFKWRFDPAESPQATTLAECASYDFKTFRDQVGKQVSCRCAQVGGGSVWGTDTYTDDSNVCAAAVYGGIIPANFSSGGEAVKVTIQAGQPSYAAGTRRGITAKSYGSWPGSFSVSR
ncbi:MAG: RICIN domain-containing protein, partial [Cystobacter sp.]